MSIDLLNRLMAPLGKEYCKIIYIIALFLFALGFLGLLSGIYCLFNKKNQKLGLYIIFNSLMTFFMYYLYRVIYSMCIKTL